MSSTPYKVYTVVADVACFASVDDALEFAKLKSKRDKNFTYYVSRIVSPESLRVDLFYNGKGGKESAAKGRKRV